ncbi:hypothetical protein GOODEAATRI_031863 [Goodea atripinnis]|uniref:Uncharacterized protein n=1 Tax=Goodea atripinnis TaxID=208336 RepID=A0ABV0P9H5_9TELE
MIMSSAMIFTPWMSPNISLADFIPKGRLRKQNRPQVVLNVHNFDDGSSSFIRQYPVVVLEQIYQGGPVSFHGGKGQYFIVSSSEPQSQRATYGSGAAGCGPLI